MTGATSAGGSRAPGLSAVPRPAGAVGGRHTPAQLARLLGLPEPTPEQAAVIGAPLAPLAVVAGAGSGKSETMAARLVWLVANGMVRPERVLGLTFTRKAAAELGQRVRARLDELGRVGLGPPGPGSGAAGAGGPAPGWQDGEPVVSTYHAYAARLVGEHALREALEPSLRLVTPAVAWQIAAREVAAHEGPMDAVDWTPAGVTAAALALAGEMSEHLRWTDDVRAVGEWLDEAVRALGGRPPALVRKIAECQRTREQLLPIVEAYSRAKAAREVIDHGDQVALAARIASRHPEVGAAERGRYEVVLLDEYQDTSHAQLVLLRALFGGGHPVTAVGDPCQSIYGWRGASAGNLRRFGADFPAGAVGTGPGRPAEVRRLSVSFRNTGRILDTAAVLQRPLRAAAPELPRLAPPTVRADRGKVVCALLETSAAEADWVAARVEGLLSLAPGTAPDGAPWAAGDDRGDQVRPRDIAVLCRKRAQIPALRAALEARGVPVEVVGLGGLLTVPEVADIVATLRVLHEPAASGALVRLLTGPRWRIGPRDLVALGRRARVLAREHRESAVATAPGGAGAPGERGAAGAGEGGPPPGDPLARAAEDVTAEDGSLVEALDDLGDPAAYSADGHDRFAALAAELRVLRGHAGRPLPDLVGEVERTLGLDVEVAARPGRDPAGARADLDAFADAAADFAEDQETPTLGAFLAFLSAAESEEFGLESGRSSGADAVTLATVHAAKGLQWPAVVVPGLAAGRRSQVFPAKPRLTTRWTENPRLLPFALRGDRADLPALPDLTRESVSSFARACADRDEAEERRLAYVAVTRAAYWLACTGYWWGAGTSRLGPSVFLTEVRDACAAGAGDVDVWAAAPEQDAQNPALAEPDAAWWPQTPRGERHQAVVEAGAMVERALERREASRAPAETPGPAEPGEGGRPAAERSSGAPVTSGIAGGSARLAAPPERDRDLVAAWRRDVGLLLRERQERNGGAGSRVWLPDHLSVSQLVAMARDPAELARQIRRPMPRPPAPRAERGAAFHRWLERRFGEQRLIDPTDVPGAADDPDGGDSEDLAVLQRRFEAGEWGDRWPLEVEAPFETLIGGRPVRGRIDAVFDDAPDGGYDVVDWKTGAPPASANESRAAAVQLAAYRLAWAGLADAPLRQVRAAFYYVRHDLTLRPADLLDEAGLTALVADLPVGAL